MTATSEPVTAQHAGTSRRPETDERKYARQTRTATVFIAWVVGIYAALTLVFVIIGVVELVALAHALAGASSGFSDITGGCASTGGFDPSC